MINWYSETQLRVRGVLLLTLLSPWGPSGSAELTMSAKIRQERPVFIGDPRISEQLRVAVSLTNDSEEEQLVVPFSDAVKRGVLRGFALDPQVKVVPELGPRPFSLAQFPVQSMSPGVRSEISFPMSEFGRPWFRSQGEYKYKLVYEPVKGCSYMEPLEAEATFQLHWIDDYPVLDQTELPTKDERWTPILAKLVVEGETGLYVFAKFDDEPAYSVFLGKIGRESRFVVAGMFDCGEGKEVINVAYPISATRLHVLTLKMLGAVLLREEVLGETAAQWPYCPAPVMARPHSPDPYSPH